MPVTLCPFCQTRYIADGDEMNACPTCARAFAVAASDVALVVPDLSLRRIAQCQRRLILVVTALIGLHALPFILLPLSRLLGAALIRIEFPWAMVAMSLPWAWLALQVVALVLVVQLLGAMKRHMVVRILYAILSLLPLLGLLLLLSANSQATRVLRRKGIHVGLFGANDAEAARRDDPSLCRVCGYSLIGNVTGRCSECGWQIACQHCDCDLSGIRSPRCPTCGTATVWAMSVVAVNGGSLMRDAV